MRRKYDWNGLGSAPRARKSTVLKTPHMEQHERKKRCIN